MVFKLISTLRYDPKQTDEPLYMFTRHRDRLVRAAKHFEWPIVIEKLEGEDGLNAMRSHLAWSVGGGDTSLRLSLRIDERGYFTADVQAVPVLSREELYPTELPSDPGTSKQSAWAAYLDTAPTQPSEFTRYKTTNREVYEQSLARVGLEDMTTSTAADVILHNDQGEISEGSRTTVYFWRNGGWVTPPLSSGANDGTTREYALENGLAKEAVVKKNSIEVGEKIFLSNGAKSFVPAVISTPPHPSE